MNTFLCQLKRELKAIFYGWLAYVVLALFWLLSGLNYYWLLLQLADGERLTFAQQLLFSGPILVFTLPVLVPLLTMKLFAEERKLGTFEILLSAPITIPCLVLSKFTAVFIFYLLLWMPHLLFVTGLNSLLVDQSSYFIQSGVVGTGLFGLILVGGLYCAIGLMMSAMTSNQVIAGLSGFALIFSGLLLFMFMGYSTQDQSWRTIGGFFSTFAHLLEFSRGVLDSRHIALYVVHTVWCLYATIKIVEWKKG